MTVETASRPAAGRVARSPRSAAAPSLGTEDIDLTCFELVAQVGSARSSFVEAIDRAENGDFEGASDAMAEGDECFKAGHDVHMRLLAREADGEQLPFRIILLHAEDLMAGAELLRIMAEKMIKLYQTR